MNSTAPECCTVDPYIQLKYCITSWINCTINQTNSVIGKMSLIQDISAIGGHWSSSVSRLCNVETPLIHADLFTFRLLCGVARRVDPCVPARCGMHQWNYSCHWFSIPQRKWCTGVRKPISSPNGPTPDHHSICGHAFLSEVAAPLVTSS